MIKRASVVTSHRVLYERSIPNIDFSGNKCFADTDCDESSPSAGWKFVKYCMRG